MASDRDPVGARRRSVAAVTVAGILAAVAGFVDAVGFARLLGVFPANQSGNVVFFGMALGGESPAPAWRTATAIVSFGLGAGAGYVLGRRVGLRRKGPLLVAIEIALLLAVIGVAGPHGESRPAGGFTGAALIVLASLAMGVQTEAIRHVAGVGVATTYQSGAVARLGEVATGTVRRPPAGRRFGFELRVLALVLVAYVAGAAVGATVVGGWRWAITVPCAVLAALALVWFVIRRHLFEDDETEAGAG
jgi:uncharacterized membrane protein YoaK (UPF0700 family)